MLAPLQKCLTVLLKKEDKMDCLVGKATCLQKVIYCEGSMTMDNQSLSIFSNCE